jgi:hypothetical protein
MKKGLIMGYRIGIFLAIVFGCMTLCARAEAMLMGLTPAQVEEAIQLGKAGKKAGMAEFSREWAVSLGEKVGWATLYSKFHDLAYRARKAAMENRELSQSEISEVLSKRDVITFTVTILTDYMYYNYHRPSTLSVGDDVRAASYEFMPQMCEDSTFFPESPYYIAACVYKFPSEGIRPDSKITLSVIKPSGDVLDFEFDLSKMR